MKGTSASLVPTSVDETGRNWERPTNRPLYATLATCAASFFAGLLLALNDNALMHVSGLVLDATSLAVLVFFCIGARRLACALIARQHSREVDVDGPQLAGPILSRQMGEFPNTSFVRANAPAEIAAFEQARREELALFEEWRGSGVSVEEVHIQSQDGLRLVGHVLHAKPVTNKWAICVHGFHGIWTEQMVHARRYVQEGYNLLFPELRCQGMSEGRYVGLGWLDRQDLVLWSRFLVDDYGQDTRIVLHGHSMGAASVCLAAAEEDLPRQVRAVVSDCAYSDIWNCATWIAREGLHVPPHPLLDFARAYLRCARGGYDLKDAAPLAVMQKVKLPILFVHGKKDSFVPPYMAMLLYDNCASQSKRLVMVEHSGHCLSCLADPQLYYGELFGFLKESLKS